MHNKRAIWLRTFSATVHHNVGANKAVFEKYAALAAISIDGRRLCLRTFLIFTI